MNRDMPPASRSNANAPFNEHDALQQRAQLDAHAAGTSPTTWRHARPAQGGRLLQRGHQLRRRRMPSPTATRPTCSARSATLVAAATRANVNVYSVDPRGVTSGMEDAIEIGGVPGRRLDQRDRADGRDAARARQPARRRRRDRRVRRAEPERLPHRVRAASSRTTAATTCSATTRPTTSATAGSATSRSRCSSRACACARAAATWRRSPAKKADADKDTPAQHVARSARRARQPDPDQRADASARSPRRSRGPATTSRSRWRSRWTGRR